jgi:serine/threonine-protein kinase
LTRIGSVRFAREGALLGALSHPFVARLLDAGVQDGQPYLVLEYVDGETIDVWCDSRALPVRERVRLFLDVLDAVAHAHVNLVLHRDLKPSNILVDAADV